MASINTYAMSGWRHAHKLTGTCKNDYSPASQRCDLRGADSWMEYTAAKNTNNVLRSLHIEMLFIS